MAVAQSESVTIKAAIKLRSVSLVKRQMQLIYRGGSGPGPASLLNSVMVSASRGNSRIAF